MFGERQSLLKLVWIRDKNVPNFSNLLSIKNLVDDYEVGDVHNKTKIVVFKYTQNILLCKYTLESRLADTMIVKMQCSITTYTIRFETLDEGYYSTQWCLSF